MKIKINIFFIGLILLVPQQLFARYEIVFTPSLTLSEQYDDNIYLDEDNKKSDWITIITTDLNLNISSQKNIFNINYSTPIVRYRDGENNNTIRQGLNLSLNSAMTQHLNFAMSDMFIRSDDPIEETEYINSVRRTRNVYYRNNGDASINYTFGTSNFFLLGFRHSYLENKDSSLDDGTIIDPYVNYSYWFNVKHGMELNAGYTDANFSRDYPRSVDTGYIEYINLYPASDDYTGYSEGITYRYRYNPHSTIFVSYNYTQRDFDGNTTDYEVYEGTVGYEKNVSEDVSYNLSAGYFIQQNDIEDENGFNANISITKNINRGSFVFSGISGWSEAYLEAEKRGFTKYQSVTSSFNYQVTENISNNASFTYRQDKDESSRKSKSIRVGYGWSWAFLRYYSMTLNYTCAVRDDDLDRGDYLDNRIMFSLRWSRPYRK